MHCCSKKDAWRNTKKPLEKHTAKTKKAIFVIDALGKLIAPDYVTRHFEVLLRKSNMRKIRFHDPRHTCATLLVMNGISLLHVSRWLGHSNINMAVTEKYYLHFDVKSQIESAIKWADPASSVGRRCVVQTFLKAG